MKCLANSDSTELQSQLLHLSPPNFPNKKCTARIIGWRDGVLGLETQLDNGGTRPQDVPKEKQIIRDFMSRNAPSLAEKQYKFQHHLDVDDYMLQYRLQHTMHITNSASLLYLSQFTSIASNGSSVVKSNTSDQVQMNDIPPVTEAEVQPEIGTTYMNGVWTIAQKYHLAPPSLTQYTNWWKFNDHGKMEQDSKIPVFGKVITPTGRNMPVTKCNLRFPSEASSSAQSKKRASEAKKSAKDDLEKLKEIPGLKNEDLRDATCKFFTLVLEQRLSQLKQKQEDNDKSDITDRPLSSSSLSKRKSRSSSAKKRVSDPEILEVTGRIPLFPARHNHSGNRNSLPHVPPVNFMSVRELCEK